jgi:hypothetical protein
VSVGNRELGSEPVDVVEVAVGAILVLLVELVDVEVLVVKARVDLFGLGRGRSSLRGDSCGLCVEGAARGGSLCSNALGGFVVRGGGGLGGRVGEVVGHLGCGPGGGGMGTHVDGCARGRDDALVLVDAVYFVAAGDASIAGDDLLGADVESRAHDGAFRGALGEDGEGREALGRRRGQTAEGAGLCLAEEGAGGLEAGEGRKLVHGSEKRERDR